MKYLFLFCLVGGFCIAQSVGAQELTYSSMVTLPKLSGTDAPAEQYVNILYVLSISIAGILAMVKIIFAGVKYMLTDVVVAKGDAKKDILGALLGLVIVLGAVLILNTINPQLSTISLFRNGPSVGVVGAGNLPETSLTNFTWDELGFNEYCIDKHAAGWINVEDERYCSVTESKPSRSATCCAYDSSYQAPPTNSSSPPPASGSYMDTGKIRDGSWCATNTGGVKTTYYCSSSEKACRDFTREIGGKPKDWSEGCREYP